jgi:hypothetical protein
LKRKSVFFVLLLLSSATGFFSNVDNEGKILLESTNKPLKVEAASANHFVQDMPLSISNQDRAIHLSYYNKSDSMRGIFFDTDSNSWVEIDRSTNTEVTKYFRRPNHNLSGVNVDFLSIEFVMTKAGLLRTTLSETSSLNCSYGTIEVLVENMDTSSIFSSTEICRPPNAGSEGQNAFFTGSTSQSNTSLSMSFSHCWLPTGSSYFDYRDYLIIINFNGSSESVGLKNRPNVDFGYWQYSCGPSGNLGKLPPSKSITTNNSNCLVTSSLLKSSSRGFSRAIQCYQTGDLSQTIGQAYCSHHQATSCIYERWSVIGSEIFFEYTEQPIQYGALSTKYLHFDNLTFADVTPTWRPTLSECTSNFFSFSQIEFLCPSSSINLTNDSWFFWNPSLNFSTWVPEIVSSNLLALSEFHFFNETSFLKIEINALQGKTVVLFISDIDADGHAIHKDAFPTDETQNLDSDGDGYGDSPFGNMSDGCPFLYGTSSIDNYGCKDTDGDLYSNEGDAFPNDPSQWNDSDDDGYGDNLAGTRGDICPEVYGESSRNYTYGCPDADFDGWADTQDHFPTESSQWNDSDGDGYGDEFNGFEGDDCIGIHGTSYLDRFGCIDADNDGISDKNDAFPINPTQTTDRDGDGFGDNQSLGATQIDLFPTDTTQWSDADGDGYGDNAAGNRGDTFPNDPNEWDDTDGDDVGNNEDAFPFDPSQTTDADGDGFGDNPRGTGADKFPEDATQWSDIDGDGYGDNMEGTTPDAFIADPTQWSDVDGDGYGDNPTGRLADAFPNDPTQWEDLDGDGFGDNLSGNNPDPYLFDFDNDGYNDSIDPLPKLASPGDLDNDGVLDENDAFPEDYREWADADGDGEGDNADTDDDNDGWTDTDEVRQGTDPFSSSSQPIDGFEVIIPGTQVSLGAWDLIGIFGGVPVFIWIAIGFATRNGRTARYEEMLRGAESVDDLERISGMWEYSLMMRMLGPHQGIRLERLRADLEYEFLGHRRTSTLMDEYDQTEHVEKSLPGLEQAVAHEPMETEQSPQSVVVSTNVPTADTAAQRSDENGYEWFTADDGTNFYRTIGSGAEWVKFEN